MKMRSSRTTSTCGGSTECYCKLVQRVFARYFEFMFVMGQEHDLRRSESLESDSILSTS